MMEETNSQKSLYDRLIEYIRQGDIELETEARGLADRFDFSAENLNSALEDGRKNPYTGSVAYARACLHIAAGDRELEKAARRLAKKHGIDNMVDINLALHIGKSRYSGGG